MLIDLEDLKPEFLGLVLDTLENYEMYRLCILICQRYNLTERIGRFVIAICQKYSNLNQFRFLFFEKFQTQNQILAQKKYALLAHEAIHNVLCLVGSGKGKKYNWINSCFESFFLQGFWRKFVFLLDTQQGIELCWAMGDISSLKLNFLVNQLGMSDPILTRQAILHPNKFQEIFITTKIKGDLSSQLI